MTTTVGGDGATKAELRRGLLLAVLLASLAGMVDVIGFIRLGNLFVSFMSGNSTQLALNLGRGHLAEALPILVLIVLFVVGAAGGQLLAHFTGRWHLTTVLAAVSALLTITALFDTAPMPMVLAMGALNAAMHRAGNVRVSLTFVTGTLVKFGEGLGDLLVAGPKDWGWAEQALPWLGITSGGILAGAVQMRFGAAVDWMPVAAAVVLFLWSLSIPAPE